MDAREIFRREEPLSGVRVVRAKDAPVSWSWRRARAVRAAGGWSTRRPDYRRVTGWGADLTRRWRHERDPRARTGPRREFMCMFCTDKVANGVSLQQETLAI